MEYDSRQLSEKQRQILEYLTANLEQTYFKSREIAEATGLSTKSVGANIAEIRSKEGIPLRIEKWAKSSSHTWKVAKTN